MKNLAIIGSMIYYHSIGVALAWPISNFKCLGTNIARLSDSRIGGWPKNTNPPSTLDWLIKKPLQKIGLLAEVKDECIWKHAERRNNVIIGTILQDRITGTKFCIANYHMPCLFYVPPTMTLHAEMAIRYVQEMAQLSTTTESNDELQDSTTSTTTRSNVTSTTTPFTSTTITTTTSSPGLLFLLFLF